MSDTVWTNWAAEQRCAPVAIERPTSEAALCEVIRRAAAAGRTVRAVGSGHSFTDCACTDGVMVDMTGLQEIVDIDKDSGRVTVQAGAKLRALGPVLAEHGLALENQGDIDAQSISGAISTATHGTGAKLPNIAARIVAMRLVTATGEVLEVSPEIDNETYLAARVSLGALGILSAVTIQCVPLYTLHRLDEPWPLDETLARLDEHVDGHDHFEFFVFPYSNRALTRRTRRSSEVPNPTPHWKRWIDEELVQNKALGLICRTGRRFPKQAPRLNRFVSSALSSAEAEDRPYKVYATNRKVKFTEMEYAIPREHGAEAVQRVMDLVAERKLPILFPLEVRFAAGDEAYLSTAHNRDSCYIAVHQYNGMEFETFFRAVEAVMDSYGGRPHWGKRHYQTAATLAGRYPEWEKFQAVRRRLDPTGVFANDYTRRVLGAD